MVLDNSAGTDRQRRLNSHCTQSCLQQAINRHDPAGHHRRRCVLGRCHALPAVWKGQILDEDAFLERAQAAGPENFPSFASEAEGEARYRALERIMPDPPGTQWLRDYIAKQAPLQNRTAPGQVLPEDWTPQERYLYQHHLDNFRRGGVPHPSGEVSTYLSHGFDINGRYYLLPGVWTGEIIDDDDEILRRAQAVGLEKFPSYANQEEGEARYRILHDLMVKDAWR